AHASVGPLTDIELGTFALVGSGGQGSVGRGNAGGRPCMNVERVIINADDLGISESVNDAIFDLMARQRVTSAPVMANRPAFRHPATKIKHFPRCSFGAHLNLTQFEPIMPRRDATLLTAADGCMSRNLGEKRFGPGFLAACYRELSAQIERLGSARIE